MLRSGPSLVRAGPAAGAVPGGGGGALAAAAGLLCGVAAVAQVQRDILVRISDMLRMDFAGRGEGYAGARTDALLHGWQGSSFAQAAVLAALLQPFSGVIGVDMNKVNDIKSFPFLYRFSSEHGVY